MNKRNTIYLKPEINYESFITCIKYGGGKLSYITF